MAFTLNVNQITGGTAILGFRLEVVNNGAGAVADAENEGRVYVITREDETGYYPLSYVRGAYNSPINSSTQVYYDHEAPLNTNLTYHVYDLASSWTNTNQNEQDDDFTTTGEDSPGAPMGFGIIHNVLDPPQRAAGVITDLSKWSRNTRTLGVHDIIGRRNPVVFTDVMGGRTGTISMTNINPWTIDFDGYGPYDQYEEMTVDKLHTMFDDGSVMLFRSDHISTGFDDLYFIADNVTETRLSRVVGATEIAMMQYDIAFTEVDRPDFQVEATPLITWQDVEDGYATWQDVENAFTTWVDVVTLNEA